MENGLLSTGVSFRGYVILRKIGSGGMGEVFLARHEVLGVDFAVKVIERSAVECDREARAGFLREVRTAARIRHPALVAVYDAGVDEATGLYFIVMDHMPGGTVADELRRQHRFSIKKALLIARTAVEGLEALEQCGVVHRDVKPGNMLMDAGGAVRLSDLGIVRDAAPASGSATQPQYTLGTPAYMPYEQIVDSDAVDARADIYALGVSLHEMLTGALPDGTLSSDELIRRRLDGERIPDIRTVNAAIPDWLADLISRMTEPDVEARLGSLRELKAELDARLSEMAPKRTVFALKTVVRKRRLTGAWVLAGGILLGCLGLAVVGALVFDDEIGRRLAATGSKPEAEMPGDGEIRRIGPAVLPEREVEPTGETVREVLREVTNDVVRIVVVTNEVARMECEPAAEKLPPECPPVVTEVAAVSPAVVCPDRLTNVVEGVEIRGSSEDREKILRLAELIVSMAETVRDVHGLPDERPVQRRVRAVELVPGDGRYAYDAETRIVSVGAAYGGFPSDGQKMANMCAGFMVSYTEGKSDPFTAQVDMLVRDRAVSEVMGFATEDFRRKSGGNPVVRRLLELESGRDPSFLSSYYRIRRDAYAKKKIFGTMTVHDFAAVVSLAAGETVFPHLRAKGLKVDEFATKVKARGLPRAEFFGE